MSLDLGAGGPRIVLRPPLLPRQVITPPADTRGVLVPVRGAPGPPGAAGGATYPHHQSSPAATWTITHNLGRFVDPTVLLDDAPERRVLTDVDLPDANTAVLTFPFPVTGWAYFN